MRQGRSFSNSVPSATDETCITIKQSRLLGYQETSSRLLGYQETSSRLLGYQEISSRLLGYQETRWHPALSWHGSDEVERPITPRKVLNQPTSCRHIVARTFFVNVLLFLSQFTKSSVVRTSLPTPLPSIKRYTLNMTIGAIRPLIEVHWMV